MSDQTKLSDQELGHVSGGSSSWRDYATGEYVNNGNYISYTVASGDVLSGISSRFGVTIKELVQWNGLSDSDSISSGQVLIIYPRMLR